MDYRVEDVVNVEYFDGISIKIKKLNFTRIITQRTEYVIQSGMKDIGTVPLVLCTKFNLCYCVYYNGVEYNSYPQSEDKSYESIKYKTLENYILANSASLDPRFRVDKENIHIIQIPLTKGHITLISEHPFDEEIIKELHPMRSYILFLEENALLKVKVKENISIAEAKDHFLASMSHELRTPLNGIMGMAELLQDAGPLTPKQREYIRVLSECAINLTSLLNNILDYSKLTANRITLRKQTLCIEDVMEKATGMIQERVREKGIILSVKYGMEFPPFIGDAQRLLQIMGNLLGNSCKFTENGSIIIEVNAKEIDNRKGYWNISFRVVDTGAGIPHEEHEKIFEMFHQSDNISNYISSSGTGLGLTISKELVKMMEGDIRVVSSGPGEGTSIEFNIILQEEININVMSETQKKLFHELKVLIVDDRPEIRIQLTDMLLKWRCNTQAVSSAQEALQYIQHGMKFDVALIDINMPHMSGVELSQEIRRIQPKLPLIGISSVTMDNGHTFFDEFMYKPIDQNNIFNAIMKCVKNKTNGKRRRKKKSSVKFLIAEDNPCNLFTLKEMLISLGYNSDLIHLTNDGKECIKKVKKVKPDVILMDIKMPGIDGIEATTIIRKKIDKLGHRQPLIIAVSAAVLQSDKEKCQSAGFDGYISKPIDKERLSAALYPATHNSKKCSETNILHDMELMRI